MLITPTGVPYEDLLPDDVVFVAADGTPAEGALMPSERVAISPDGL